MSRFEIKMPKLGESITEGTIISWSVQVGDIIKEDDVLFEVNTAKVSGKKACMFRLIGKPVPVSVNST